MKLVPYKFGVALGIVWMFSMFFLVNIRGLPLFKLIQEVYIGCNYDNKLLCFLYAFIDGFIGGYIIAYIYNVL